MATETLVPDADALTDAQWTTTPYFSKISQDPASHDNDTTFIEGPNVTASSNNIFIGLSDTVSGFDPGGISAITVDAAHRKNSAGVSNGIDACTLFYQVFRSDRTTAITDEVTTGDLATTYARNQLSAAGTGTHTKTDWDGAVLRIRSTFSAAGCVDTTCRARVTAARVIVVWEAAQNFTRTVDDSLGLLDDADKGIIRIVDDALGLVDDQVVDADGGGETINVVVKRVILIDLVD